IGNAVRWMQRAAGVADDGVIGPATLAAVSRAEPADLVLAFNAERLECKLVRQAVALHALPEVALINGNGAISREVENVHRRVPAFCNAKLGLAPWVARQIYIAALVRQHAVNKV
ncbi:MAG: peptidoglycan-binding protein, partial [Pseudomonadota bacterium]|nr:peptidoglycan-binding protein [Pseudomonadota bacterium]